MSMNNDNKFILTPIIELLHEAIWVTNSIGNGIETYPVSEYIMQSIFIKLTGAQEQKMKLIIWELANNDLDCRRDFLGGKYTNKVFSEYDDKQYVYKTLIQEIKKLDPNFFSVPTDQKEKRECLEKRKEVLKRTNLNCIKNSSLYYWSQKNYEQYLSWWNGIKPNNFAPEATTLLSPQLAEIYKDYLYKYRNRVAHNTMVIQKNKPTLRSLIQSNIYQDNYFIWFSILILIDNLFIELFSIYLKNLEKKKFI